MAGPRSSTRERILDAAYDLFYRHGFARVSVDMVADNAGVTKRTLYYHFESKDALAGEALSVQDAFILKEVESWNLSNATSKQALIATLMAKMQVWAQRDGWTGSGYSRLTMELATFRAILRGRQQVDIRGRLRPYSVGSWSG